MDAEVVNAGRRTGEAALEEDVDGRQRTTGMIAIPKKRL